MNLLRPRVVLAVPRALDCAGLAVLLNGPNCELVGSFVDLSIAAEKCKEEGADALIVDVGFPNRGAFHVARALIFRKVVRAAVFLDNWMTVGRALVALDVPNSSYVTRDASADELLHMLGVTLRLSKTPSNQLSMPKGRNQSTQLRLNGHTEPWEVGSASTRHAITRVDQLHEHDRFGVLRLTPRERQVIELLAAGKTVKQAGVAMGLSHSTVDNHKARLMRKLGVHRSSQVVRIAVETGMVD